MAFLPSLLFFLVIVYLALPCQCSNGVRGLHSIKTSSLSLPPTECSPTPTALNNSTLQIVHQHGPCSSLGTGHQIIPIHPIILQADQTRASAIQNKVSISLPATNASLNDFPGGRQEYVVTIGLGTPSKTYPVIFDISSDLSFIECDSSSTGQDHSQNETIFDPSQSSTYSNVSCFAPDCSLVGTTCDSSTCLYSIHYGYGEGWFSSGVFATETLSLTPHDVVTNFEFGCSKSKNGNGAFGRLGLGLGKVSLATQVADTYGGVFSYCFPSTSSSTGHLTFGRGSWDSDISFTPIIPRTGYPFYFLELVGISIGGKDLKIPPAVFSRAGTLIDSGTAVTRLPPFAYTVLRDEFRKYMIEYPTAPTLSIFYTCYNFTGFHTSQFPEVGLTFGGGTILQVDPLGIFYVASQSQVCLAFAPSNNADSVSIIGNMQQRNYNVVYDTGKQMIGFASGGC